MSSDPTPDTKSDHSVSLDWYFDFVSPFAYLQHTQLKQLPANCEIRYQPVLFAGILNAWGQRGPAELSTKREFTYRHVQWLADRNNIPFRFPPAHPFNPLPALRLCLALDNDPTVIERLFHFIWVDGNDLSSANDWRRLTESLSLTDVDQLIKSSVVKAKLKHNTESAIANGVFGVPSFRTNGQLFWGQDSFDMLLDFVENPRRFEDPEYTRLRLLPSSANRL